MLFSLLTAFLIMVSVTDKPAYVIYKADGTRIAYSEMVNGAAEGKVIFFGELHNNTIAHWLQLELTRDLHTRDDRPLKIGFEMFEADQQVLLDEYTSGHISTTSFEREARLWNNYSTDYKPVFEFGRANDLRLVATNIPRRYASMVHGKGLESLDQLTDTAKEWMTPLPIEVDLSLPGYANMLSMGQGHGGENLPKAQAVKDATMAHFILLNLSENDRFLHLNGSYHSDNFEGIIWYLQRSVSDLKMVTITTIEAEDPEQITPDLLKKADFTIVVPSRMTKTY